AVLRHTSKSAMKSAHPDRQFPPSCGNVRPHTAENVGLNVCSHGGRHMARGIHRLTPRKVATLGEGLHHDGGGLYLQVKGNGRSWLFRYGTHWMGLGSADTWRLAEARERARRCRQQRDDGIDPIEARKAAKLNQELAKAKDVTFRECAEGWM